MITRFFTLLLFIAFVTPAAASVKIDITRGHADPLPIAILDFGGATGSDQTFGKDMARVIRNNLKRSGLFAPVKEGSFIQKPGNRDFLPRFADWRVINAPALVYGFVETDGPGRLKVQFRLWDVFAEKQLVGLAYFTEKDNWRRIGHIISDAIYKRMTGEEGYFDSRIVYIAESGRADRRIKRLAIMDQDGANHRYLTDGKNLVLTPRFDPTSQQITYMAYYGGRPRVYLLNIDTGREDVLGDFPGMTFSPRFSPDGKSVILTLAENGNSDIYTLHLKSRRIKRLTKNRAIDTSPSFSPDGKRVVFNSDRGGTQQLYTMSASGSNLKRISFGKGRYGTPVWSPRGDLIAFTRQYKGKFYIGIMKPDGSGERLLTESFLDEGPTWAPNGRVLAFFRQGPSRRGRSGKTQIYTIDLTGNNLRRLPTPKEASDPAWSPLIP